MALDPRDPGAPAAAFAVRGGSRGLRLDPPGRGEALLASDDGVLVLHVDRSAAGEPLRLRLRASNAAARALLAERRLSLHTGEIVAGAGAPGVPGQVGRLLARAWEVVCAGGTSLGEEPPHPDHEGPATALAYAVTSLPPDRALLTFRSSHLGDPDRELSSDPLTGLPGRAALLAHLQRVGAAARLGGPSFAVLLLELDELGDLRGILGHAAADSFVRAAARRLSAAVSTHDLVARVGGERFVVVVHGVADEESMRAWHTRLARELARPLDLEGLGLRPTARVGMVLGDGTTEAEELLQDGDLALFAARAHGPGSVVAYDASMRLDVVERVLTLHAIGDALERDELVLHFQPVLWASDLRAAGAEALLRWRHPRRGLLFPEAFLPALAAGTSAVDVGEWVIERVAATAAAWSAEHDLDGYRIGFNLAPQHILHSDVVATFEAALARHGGHARHFVVEISHSGLLSTPEEVRRQVLRLRELGVRVAVDDFGSRGADLTALRDLPVDLVKVDPALVTPSSSTRARAILRGIVAMCADLGADVALEAVDTEAQLELARECGVTFVQGFHLGRPVAAGPGTELPVRDPLPSRG